MENNAADKVTVTGGGDSDCSMVEIKIKTLDSQIYTLRVDKCMPVPALKEQIATVTGVLSEQQRLICRGKVLKDDQLLSAYHVEDGHTLHLVARQPFHPSSSTTTGVNSADPSDPSSNGAHSRGNNVAHSLVLGTFNIGDQGDGVAPDLNRIVSAVLSSIGISNIGTEHVTERLNRVSLASGTSGSTQAPFQQTSSRAQSDSIHDAFQSPLPVSLGSIPPPVIPDSLTTISQYLSHLRNEFNAIGRSYSEVVGDNGLNGMERQDHNGSSTSGAGQGLPTPSALAEIMHSARLLLIEQAGRCLSQLARQLENHANVNEAPARDNIQTNAIRSGVLLHNLGTLLLELGRTIMTLRMGQTPAEAVVNAGPSIFISTAGPNPLMVQPPFQPGSSFGAIPTGSVNLGHGLGSSLLGSGPGFLPRNIDIRIRTGPSMSSGSAGQGERAGAGQPDPAISAGQNVAAQPVSGVSGSSSFTGESRVRVVPVRTVVAAVPAALGRPPSDSSGSTVGLFYPLLARFQHLSSGHANDTRVSQVSGDNHQSGHETTQPNAGSNGGLSRSEGNVQSVNFSTTNGLSVTADMSPSANTSAQNDQGLLPNTHSTQREPSYSSNDQNNTQSHDMPTTNQDSTTQIPSRFDQLLRTIFSGEQLNFSEINFQARPTGPITEQTADQRDGEANEASRTEMDPGVFFSGLVRQIMPFIAQTTPNGSPVRAESANENTDPDPSILMERETSSDAGNSHRRGDLSPPSPKRQKRD